MIEQLMRQYNINEEHAIKIMQLDPESKRLKLQEMDEWKKHSVGRIEVINER